MPVWMSGLVAAQKCRPGAIGLEQQVAAPKTGIVMPAQSALTWHRRVLIELKSLETVKLQVPLHDASPPAKLGRPPSTLAPDRLSVAQQSGLAVLQSSGPSQARVEPLQLAVDAMQLSPVTVVLAVATQHSSPTGQVALPQTTPLGPATVMSALALASRLMLKSPFLDEVVSSPQPAPEIDKSVQVKIRMVWRMAGMRSRARDRRQALVVGRPIQQKFTSGAQSTCGPYIAGGGYFLRRSS